MENGLHGVHAPPGEIWERAAQGSDAFGHQLSVEGLLLKARCEVLLHSSQMVRL